MAEAALGQARGDAAAVLRALRPLIGLAEVSGWSRAYEPWWRILATDALIGAGRLDQAQDSVDRLSELAETMPVLHPVVAWLAGSLASARGDEATAFGLFSGTVNDDTRHRGNGGGSGDGLPLYRALLE